MRNKTFYLFIICIVFFVVMNSSMTIASGDDWDMEREGEIVEISSEMTAFFSYVQLRINNEVVTPFYEILLTAEEDLYIPLLQTFEELELYTYNYNSEADYLEVTVYTLEQDYKIDFTDGLLLGSETELELKEDDYVIKEGEIYLSYELFSQWFPLEIAWDNLFYETVIDTEFQTLSQLFAQRDQARKVLQKESEKIEEILKPETDFFVPGTFNYEFSLGSGKDNWRTGLNLGYFGHLLHGDFKSRFLINEAGIHRSRLSLTYPELDNFGEVVVGDSFLSFSPVLRRNASVFGFSTTNSPNEYKYGISTLRGEVPEGSDVELHYRNRLIDYQRAEDGIYKFTDIPLDSSYNTFKIVVYTPRGEVYTEFEYIASRPEQLEPGKYEHQAGLGWNDGQLMTTNSFNYGLNEEISLRADLQSFAEDERQVYLGSGISYNPLLDHNFFFDTYLQPGTGFAYHGGINSLVDVWQLEGSLTGYNNVLPPRREEEWTGEKYDYLDQEIELKAVNTEQRYGLDYTLSNFSSNLQHQIGANYRLSPYPRTSLRLRNNLKVRPDSNWANEVRADSTFFGLEDRRISGHSRLEFGSNNLLNYSLALNFKHDYSEVLAYRVGLNYGNYGFYPRLRVNYDISDEADLTVNVSRTEADLLFTFRESRTAEWPPEKIDAPTQDRSWIKGRVFLDEEGDGQWQEGMPLLSEVGIEVNGSRVGETNESGEFFITNVASYRDIEINIDPESLDALYIPMGGKRHAHLRPGLGVNLDFAVVPVSGISGSLEGYRDLPRGLRRRIEIGLFDQQGEEIARVRPEFDGFYVFEDVKPGDYVLDLIAPNGISNLTGSREITIPFSELPTWLQNENFVVESQ